MLEHVYSNPSMKEHFAVVYRLGVEFLREAALYYSIGTHKRLWHVLTRPPSVDIETKVSGIKGAIEEMTREMETFDRIRLKGVEVSIEGHQYHAIWGVIHNTDFSFNSYTYPKR
jgi:hypothetical protein